MLTIAILSSIGAAIVGLFIWALVPENSGRAIEISKGQPLAIEDGDEKWRKEIEAYNRKQVTDWDKEFKETEREAWAAKIGIPVAKIQKYLRTLKECQQLRLIIRAWGNDTCDGIGDSYTQRSASGYIVSEYTSPCSCTICRQPEFRRKLEVKEGIIRILDEEIRKTNPQFISGLDLDDTGAKMIESWETHLPAER